MAALTLCPRTFRKATRSQSGGGNCVECTRRDGFVFLRDDKVPFGSPGDGILVFTEQQFDEYQAGVRAGDATGLCIAVTERPDGLFVFRSGVNDEDLTELVFDIGELEAFQDGIVNHEFDEEGTHAGCTAECATNHRHVELVAV